MMSAVSGHHMWISRHRGLLGHTAMRLRKQPTPAYKRCVAERVTKRVFQPVSQALSPKKFAGRAPQQTISVESLRSPPQVTTFIKQQEQIATGLTSGHDPEAGLISFCASMEGLLSRSGLRTDYIHFAAIITAAAHIWKEAQRSPRFSGHADVGQRLKALLQQCLHNLQMLLAEMETREISNVLWSSATLGFNPDDAVPGLVYALTSKFLYFINTDVEKQRPSAQNAANVMWAFATMGHPAATTPVVAAISSHFGRLVDSPTAQQRPSAQQVANLVWALGTLEHTPSDDTLLDRLCKYMRDLLYSHDPGCRPIAQNIANTLWALAQLKHALSHDVVTVMLDYLVASPGLNPTPQEVSNCFIACAELDLDVKPTCLEVLLKHFMEMHVSDVRYQHYCNAAWSLAVMQCLDLNTFEAFLDKLTSKHTLVVQESGPQSASAQLHPADITQLYQALAWLRPRPDSKQMKAWSSLRARLLTVAPEPAAKTVFVPGQSMMWAALAAQEVPYKVHVERGVYQADALLSPRAKGVAEVILMVERRGERLINSPNRITGSAAFRNQLLARYGTVVAITYNPASSTTKSMADDIKAAVEAKTGLPLGAFRS